MIVKHNMAALGSVRALGINEKNKIKSLEKLSTGYKINRAADNAAGLAISEEMRAQIRGLNRAVQNIEDGISYVQTADAALSEVHDILHRIHELAVESANDTNTEDDRECIDTEVQLLKEEMDRIFEETEFNTIPIWSTDTNSKVQIGTEKKQALTMFTSSQTITLNETNKAAVAIDSFAQYGVQSTNSVFYHENYGFSGVNYGYKIEVQGTDPSDPTTYGFKVTWEGWNNKKYSTELVSWDDVGTGAFAMNISDYLKKPLEPELEGVDFRIGWTTVDSSVVTIADVAASIDGCVFGTGMNSYESLSYEVNGKNSSVLSTSVQINYLAELASGRNVETDDTIWMEAKNSGSTNVISQPSYTNPDETIGWTLHFYMPGIGDVTATSASVYYLAGDRTDDTENIFWHWVYPKYSPKYQSGNTLRPTATPAGSLNAVTDCASNDNLNANGTINDSLKNSNRGGTIYLKFALTPDNGSFSYAGRSYNKVGTITMSFSVPQNENIDAERFIMEKLQKEFDSNTVFDVSKSASNKTSQTVSAATAKKREVDVPLYKATHDLVIQAGANANQLIHVTYDSLRVLSLGLEDTNVLDSKTATKAIAEIQAAEQVISAQRSLFGSYQNRFEHAREVDANTSENLQAAESKIRDTDMADEMVQLSAANILAEAGQAMLAQANKMTEGVLILLQ